jgi:hypothetical protein
MLYKQNVMLETLPIEISMISIVMTKTRVYQLTLPPYRNDDSFNSRAQKATL